MNFHRVFKAVVAKAIVKHITPHDLRWTYATRVIRKGIPLPTVEKLTEH